MCGRACRIEWPSELKKLETGQDGAKGVGFARYIRKEQGSESERAKRQSREV